MLSCPRRTRAPGGQCVYGAGTFTIENCHAQHRTGRGSFRAGNRGCRVKLDYYVRTVAQEVEQCVVEVILEVRQLVSFVCHVGVTPAWNELHLEVAAKQVRCCACQGAGNDEPMLFARRVTAQ